MPSEALTLRPAGPDDLSAVADLFLASRAAAVPQMPPVVDEADARRWVLGWDLGRAGGLARRRPGPASSASRRSRTAGCQACTSRPTGSATASAAPCSRWSRPSGRDGFALWVFESNERARAFYRRHGLVELEHTDGADNRERSPDLRMAWPGADPVAYFRREIDDVDQILAVLLGRRAALTGAVQDHKGVSGHAGRDPDREKRDRAAHEHACSWTGSRRGRPDHAHGDRGVAGCLGGASRVETRPSEFDASARG